ncbi:SDR family oxidoreductase [Nocardia sp. JMUB6875]|uniref:NAD(P)H-binding protein n=1 Tax=Nocardia sp. JMUB6875 TaxID=3158170 RepID=UPI0032E64338
MTIVIAGAAGYLGRLTISSLLERGVEPRSIVAAVRSPARASDLAARGVQVRYADYDRPETVDEALAGARRVLLISGTAVGRRVPQHKTVIDAAAKAGAELITYVGLLHATDSPLAIATEHRETEEVLRHSPVPYSVLRNGWYWENYLRSGWNWWDPSGTLADFMMERGVLIGAAGDGLLAAASRADYAAAAAAVLTGSGHENTVYSLGGDERITLSELAAIYGEVFGRDFVYRDLTRADFKAALLEAGVAEQVAEHLADSDDGISKGALDTDSGDLRRLLGRPSTPVRTVLARER